MIAAGRGRVAGLLGGAGVVLLAGCNAAPSATPPATVATAAAPAPADLVLTHDIVYTMDAVRRAGPRPRPFVTAASWSWAPTPRCAS